MLAANHLNSYCLDDIAIPKQTKCWGIVFYEATTKTQKILQLTLWRGQGVRVRIMLIQRINQVSILFLKCYKVFPLLLGLPFKMLIKTKVAFRVGTRCLESWYLCWKKLYMMQCIYWSCLLFRTIALTFIAMSA